MRRETLGCCKANMQKRVLNKTKGGKSTGSKLKAADQRT